MQKLKATIMAGLLRIMFLFYSNPPMLPITLKQLVYLLRSYGILIPGFRH
jgi:hypothetical protein